MAKFICENLGWNLQSNRYSTPKGNEYMFHLNSPTDVPDPEDAEFFRKVPGFKEVGLIEKIKETISPKPEKKLTDLTESDIKAMNRNEQVEIIRKLNPTARIPGMEKERIKLILDEITKLPKE